MGTVRALAVQIYTASSRKFSLPIRAQLLLQLRATVAEWSNALHSSCSPRTRAQVQTLPVVPLLPLRSMPRPSARPHHHHDMSVKRATGKLRTADTSPPTRSTTPPATHAVLRPQVPPPRDNAAQTTQPVGGLE